jgi:predicted TIM-barrel enzyme
MRITREECLKRLRQNIKDNKPILGVGAGTGISAKCAEKGGADLIIIYNSGRYRMAGRGSMAGLMPYGDANAIVMEMAGEVLPVVKNTPVLAGICGTDPFRIMDVFLKQVAEVQFSGVQNFPTVGVYETNTVARENYEATGMGYDLEVAMIATAHNLDLLTCPYAFTEEEARQMAGAGADLVVAHMGLTTKGTIGAGVAMTLEQAAEKVQKIHDAATSVNPEVMVICHGGPISEPKDAEYILRNTKGVVGFFGASSIERLAAESAITEQTREFKQISVK